MVFNGNGVNPYAESAPWWHPDEMGIEGRSRLHFWTDLHHIILLRPAKPYNNKLYDYIILGVSH